MVKVSEKKSMLEKFRANVLNEIKGGKVLAQEAIDSLSLLAHANTELNNRRKELIKPDLHTDYKHLCSASTTVTAELFGDDPRGCTP